MNLEQFKETFNSELHVRCGKQEETIKGLHAKITEQQTTIVQLQNRCFVFHGGLMCPMCGFREDCHPYGKHENEGEKK